MEYYRREADTMRARYNDVFLEKERLEQEVNSVRCCLEDERKEMAELRRQQQVRISFAIHIRILFFFFPLQRIVPSP